MKKNKFTKLIIMSLLCLPVMTSVSAQSNQGKTVQLTEVIFEEMEPGIEPFRSRLLLGKNFLRLDDGNDFGGFVLFDRNSHQIHSFNLEDRSHLIMKQLPAKKLDFKLDFRREKITLKEAPKIQGIIAQQNRYFANNQLCKTSINASGLLPELVQVLIAYEQVIVEQNKRTLSQIPDSILSGCYMANNYLHASDYLQAGFPLSVTDDLGRRKHLLSIKEIQKPVSIMQQLQGYRVYYPNAANLEN